MNSNWITVGRAGSFAFYYVLTRLWLTDGSSGALFFFGFFWKRSSCSPRSCVISWSWFVSSSQVYSVVLGDEAWHYATLRPRGEDMRRETGPEWWRDGRVDELAVSLCSRRDHTSFRRSLPSFLFSLLVSSLPAAVSLFSVPAVFPPSLCSPVSIFYSHLLQISGKAFLPSFLCLVLLLLLLLLLPPHLKGTIERKQRRESSGEWASWVKRRVLTRGVYFFLWEATQS